MMSYCDKPTIGMFAIFDDIFSAVSCLYGELASEANERLGHPTPSSRHWSKTSLEDPTWAWGEQVRGMWYFPPSVLWHCWLGNRKGCIKLDVGFVGVTIWLELCTSYSSSCHHSPPPSSSLDLIKSERYRTVPYPAYQPISHADCSQLLNAAARLIYQLRSSDHITDALVCLHWLRIPKSA